MQTEEARANQSRPAGGFPGSHIQINEDTKYQQLSSGGALVDSWRVGKLVKVAGESQSLRAKLDDEPQLFRYVKFSK